MELYEDRYLCHAAQTVTRHQPRILVASAATTLERAFHLGATSAGTKLSFFVGHGRDLAVAYVLDVRAAARTSSV
jgi:hypothetical protein